MPRRDSRTLILDAARTEFGARGFDGARVARVAEQAGVNKQLIFYYFGSKAGLYESVTTDAASQVGIAGGSAGPQTEGVRRVVENLYDSLHARPELVASFVRRRRAGDSNVPDDALRDLERELASVISTGQGLGYFRDDADPGIVARQGVLLCVGFLAVVDRLTAPDRDQWAREVGETLVRRLAW